LQRCTLEPVAVGGPQSRPRDRYRELSQPVCNIAGGVISPLLMNVALLPSAVCDCNDLIWEVVGIDVAFLDPSLL